MLPRTKSSRFLVAVTGKNASGKGEACLTLSHHGYSLLSLSDVVREEVKKRGQEPSREIMIPLANEMRASHGPGVLATITVQNMKDGNYVVDSIRHPEEVKILRTAGRFLLIGVDAPIEVRFQRALTRGRNENADTLERFRELENRERTSNPLAQQLDETFKLADVVILNNGTVDEFRAKVASVLRLKAFPWQD